jgi:predicted phage terminase large subunit-like protein
LDATELANAWRWFPHTYAARVSEGRFKRYRHVDFAARKFVEAISQGNARLVISMPPRHGKSEEFSTWVPVWFLDNFPEKRIMLTSYAAELADEFGRKVRNEMADNPLVRTKLRGDSKAANRFHTSKGGGMTTLGVGGSATGKGADLFVIDDPYKDPRQAMSPTYNKHLRDWYEAVARTRLEPGGSMVLIMTRWTADDLAAHLVKTFGFTEIKLAAIAEKDDPLGRAEGEALCPERYDVAALMRTKEEVGSYVWQALYQQNPVPIGGALIKRAWWKYYRETPRAFLRKIQCWDTAQKPGVTNDYTVCATWGETPTGYYLLDLLRIKVAFPGLQQALLSAYHKHMPQAVVIEDKSSGISLIQYAQAETRLPIIPYDPAQDDKVIRAAAAAPTIEAGNCHLPAEAPYLEDFVLEHERFPLGEHDDQVDTTSLAMDFFKARKLKRRASVTMLG